MSKETVDRSTPPEFYEVAQKLMNDPGFQVGRARLLELAAQGETGIFEYSAREENCPFEELTSMGVDESFLTQLLNAWPDRARKEVARWSFPGNRGVHSSLFSAVRQGYAELTKALIDLGADPHKAGPAGDSLLYDAAGSGSFQTLEILLKQGLDINCPNSEGRTPLMELCFLKQASSTQQAMRWLVECGARIDLRDRQGKTAYDLARQVGHQEALEVLDRARARDEANMLARETARVESKGASRRM